MPYKTRGKVILVKRGGKWVVFSNERDEATARRKAHWLESQMHKKGHG
jgi:hypothetical protein